MNPFLARLPLDCRLRTHGATEDSYQKGTGSRFRMTSRHRSGVFLPEGSCVNGMGNKIFFSLTFRTILSTRWDAFTPSCTVDVSGRRPRGGCQNLDYPLPSAAPCLQPGAHTAGPACPHSSQGCSLLWATSFWIPSGLFLGAH